MYDDPEAKQPVPGEVFRTVYCDRIYAVSQEDPSGAAYVLRWTPKGGTWTAVEALRGEILTMWACDAERRASLATRAHAMAEIECLEHKKLHTAERAYRVAIEDNGGRCCEGHTRPGECRACDAERALTLAGGHP